MPVCATLRSDLRHGHAYNSYVQRDDRFRRMEEGVATVRRRYGASVSMQLNFLIMRPSCSVAALQAAWRFAEQYDMSFHTDLIHYSLPYFTEGRDRELQFTEADRPAITELVAELARLKQADPKRHRTATEYSLHPGLAAERSRHAGSLRRASAVVGRGGRDSAAVLRDLPAREHP